MKDRLDQNGRVELEQLFKRLDTDGSGTIDYNEFIAMSIDQGIYLKQDKLYMAFKLLDVDGSGKISKDELKKVLGADSCFSDINDSYWESMIQEADANGDGEIDYSEFTQLMKGIAKGS
jgi:calcium-dependent protein kinase